MIVSQLSHSTIPVWSSEFREHFHTVSGSCCGNKCGCAMSNGKLTNLWYSCITPGYIPQSIKDNREAFIPRFAVALLTIDKWWKHKPMDKENVDYIHYILAHQEEEKNHICGKRGKTGNHVKWNKLDSKRQILHIEFFLRHESRKEVIREEERGKYIQLPYICERKGLFCTIKYTLIKRK